MRGSGFVLLVIVLRCSKSLCTIIRDTWITADGFWDTIEVEHGLESNNFR